MQNGSAACHRAIFQTGLAISARLLQTSVPEERLKPVQRRNGKSVSDEVVCPLCGATHHYLYDNNGGNGQFQCKICGQTFITGEQVTKPLKLKCPYCGHALSLVKHCKFFIIHKCINHRCSFYQHNLKSVNPEEMAKNEKYKFKFTTSTVNSP